MLEPAEPEERTSTLRQATGSAHGVAPSAASKRKAVASGSLGRPAPPPLPVAQFTRWMWRQLTSMRTALLLLLLLALAAIPGSLIPQTKVDPSAVVLFSQKHPALTPVLSRLDMFAVYSSPWFSAIYLLLMVSLIGCIIPRSLVYARSVRARPPRAPQNLTRLPASAAFVTEESVTVVLRRAHRLLRSQRYRVDLDIESHSQDVTVGSVRAQKGYLREAGNLVFHVCLVVAFAGVAVGSLFGYKAGVIVIEGEGFSNTVSRYDEFSAGSMFSVDSLPPFTVNMDSFTAKFQTDGPQRGAPTLFDAKGTYTAQPGEAPAAFDIQVNHPLEVDGSSVYLVGSGYAPVITVRDRSGSVVFSGAVPFLPRNALYTSTGVVKVPDTQPQQLGLEGYFLPTAAVDANGSPVSEFPEPVNPILGLFVYTGDLGLNTGVPQSVYALDKSGLTQVMGSDGQPTALLMRPGATVTLPHGLGTVSFDDIKEFAKFQVSRSPGKRIPLIAGLLGILGLTASLALRPRRAWVRARTRDGRTMVEVARLDRVAGADLERDVQALVSRLRGGETAEPSTQTPAR